MVCSRYSFFFFLDVILLTCLQITTTTGAVYEFAGSPMFTFNHTWLMLLSSQTVVAVVAALALVALSGMGFISEPCAAKPVIKALSFVAWMSFFFFVAAFGIHDSAKGAEMIGSDGYLITTLPGNQVINSTVAARWFVLMLAVVATGGWNILRVCQCLVDFYHGYSYAGMSRVGVTPAKAWRRQTR